MSDSPARYAWYSIAASIVTLTLKFGAWWLTGSVGLLSDAVESLINLAAGLMALGALTVAAMPADDRHAYGHHKAEYFSSLTEGALILVAAGGIFYTAYQRFHNPAPLEHLGPGLLVSVAASAVNFLTARIMLGAARRFDSITLEADARHLLTDVWTSVGLAAGLAVMLAFPTLTYLDPLLAALMAGNIVFTAVGLMRRSLHGLMDHALPAGELQQVHEAIQASAPPEARYHGLRTRKAGPRRFVDFHLLLPGATSVREAHDVCQKVEAAIEGRLERCHVTCHIEPLEDPAAWDGEVVGGDHDGGPAAV